MRSVSVQMLLQQGLIQGSNAQQAAMSLITATPTMADKEGLQYISGTSAFTPQLTIYDSFFVVPKANCTSRSLSGKATHNPTNNSKPKPF